MGMTFLYLLSSTLAASSGSCSFKRQLLQNAQWERKTPTFPTTFPSRGQLRAHRWVPPPPQTPEEAFIAGQHLHVASSVPAPVGPECKVRLGRRLPTRTSLDCPYDSQAEHSYRNFVAVRNEYPDAHSLSWKNACVSQALAGALI